MSKTASLSADGQTLLFISQSRLTDGENSGPRCSNSRLSQEPGPCKQLYRYHAPSDELLCVSCTPTNATPQGAASLQTIQSTGPTSPNSRGAVLLRNLSEDGNRVFFESTDKLVVGDVNGDASCPIGRRYSGGRGRHLPRLPRRL